MGWYDYHLHQFELVDPSSGMKKMIGIPDDEFGGLGNTLPGEKEKISKWFSLENSMADYTYDFGDNWEHIMKLEKILPRETGVRYPKCIAGKLACPPEDCGGVWGFVDLLQILGDPENEEYEDMREWAGDDFDPQHFNANEVVFTDPAKRLRGLFG